MSDGCTLDVTGFEQADDKWNTLKAAWDDCEKNDRDIPDEVLGFFGEQDPLDTPGMEVNLKEALVEWSSDRSRGTGFELDVSKLPPNVSIIRFVLGPG